MPKSDLQKRIAELIKAYEGVRAAARAVDIDPSYLQRLQAGKSAGSPETLKKLGLSAQVHYAPIKVRVRG
jgi:hypothetical protein